MVKIIYEHRFLLNANMKIDPSSNTAPPLAVKKPTKPAQQVSVEVASKAERLAPKTTSERISQWFAQAGILPHNQRHQSASIDTRVLRRGKIAAHKKQRNIESVLDKALNFCIEDNKNEPLDPDWFFNFIQMAEEIYSPAMQELWGKIFAVETSRPGSFSLRTLLTLKQLTHKDAQIFRQAVTLASRRKGESTPKLIIGYHRKSSVWSWFTLRPEQHLNLARFGLGYPDLLSLMDLGLIYQTEIESGELPINTGSEWKNGSHAFQLMPRKTNTTLVYYKFTSTGAELFSLVSADNPDTYLNELRRTLQSAFEVS